MAATTPKKPAAPKTAAPKLAASEPAPEAPAAALDVGAPAPAFTLAGDRGAEVSLADFAGKKLVVYFYPKDDTPGCTREACAFRDKLGAVAAAGAAVVGVSRDGTAKHAKFRDKYGLTFPLLSDLDGAVHRAYGAWGTKSMYGKAITGALRTTVLVDEQGRVAKVWRSVKVDGHADAVLAALG